MNQTQQSFDTLVQAFQEYKTTNEQRLCELERKGSADALLSDKLSRLDLVLDQKMDHLKKLELATKRPVLGSEGRGQAYESLAQKQGFLTYVRQGEISALETKGLHTQTSEEGGYLIPQVISERIGETLTAHSPLRRLATVIEISSGALELLLDKKGAEAAWTGEVDPREETAAPQLQKLTIPTHELYAKPKATQKLLDDAKANVEEWLTRAIATKMAQMEHQAFLTGNGDKKPRGILSYDTVLGAQWTWGKLEHVLSNQNGEGIHMDHLIQLMMSLKPEFMPGASWVMSRSALSEIRKLKAADGSYLWQPALDTSFKSSLFGYPIEIADDLPAYKEKAACQPVLFGNFKAGYQIVDRAGIQILRDPYSAKPYIEFYATKRVGGDVVNFEAIKVLSCGK